MTKLKLQLAPKTFIWSLVNPKDPKKFIKRSDEPGYQDVGLILSQSSPGPHEVEYEALPSWARSQVETAIASGQIVNTGDKITKPAATNKETLAKEIKTTSSNKKATSKGAPASTEKQSA